MSRESVLHSSDPAGVPMLDMSWTVFSESQHAKHEMETVNNMNRFVIIAEQTEQTIELQEQFALSGSELIVAQNVSEWESQSSSSIPDAVIVDLGLLGIDAIQLVKKIRRNFTSMSIILLSERDMVDQRARALAEGADDYLTKPCTFADLNLRIETLLRRKSLPPNTTLSFQDLEINLLTRTIKVKGQPIHMPSRPFALLSYFVKHQEEVISREKLARDVWSDESVVGKNVIEVYINQTRARFAQLGHPLQLQTIRGKGYRLGGGPQ